MHKPCNITCLSRAVKYQKTTPTVSSSLKDILCRNTCKTLSAVRSTMISRPRLSSSHNRTQSRLISTTRTLFRREDPATPVANEATFLSSKPMVTIVGRPNVGKSTFFNTLIDKSLTQKAIVSPVPGTTRDRSYGTCTWLGREFAVVDTGGILGYVPKEDTISQHVKDQVILAMKEANVIVFLVDIREGLTNHDKEIARLLRTHAKEKRVIVAANKADDLALQTEELLEPFKRLGFGLPICLSAAHSSGIGDVLDAVIQDMQPVEYIPVSKKLLKKQEQEQEKVIQQQAQQPAKPYTQILDSQPTVGPTEQSKASETTEVDKEESALTLSDEEFISSLEKDKETAEPLPESVRIAIVGQPNVGKSSLLNTILKKERSVVSEIPGTTHDPVDEQISWKGTAVTLIDTAGITKQAKHEKGLARTSILWSLKAIERCHVAILLVDPVLGLNSQDESIASHIKDHKRSVVVAVNKWDTLRNKPYAKSDYINHIREKLNFMSYVPVELISAKTGYHVQALMDLAIQAFKERGYRLSINDLNEVIKRATTQHAPPYKNGKQLKIKFATQANMFPPTFIFFVNDTELVTPSYHKYLEGAIRELHGFVGSPIVIHFRQNVGKQPSPRKRK